MQQAGYHPLERYPPREANESAHRVEELLAPHGFRLAPVEAVGRPPVDSGRAERMEQLDGLVRDRLRLDSATRAELPAELTAWIEEIGPALRGVRSEILGAEPPAWELRLDQGASAPLPNLIDHMRLHRLLLFAATTAANTDREEAEAWLRAASVLRNGVHRDPLLLHRLISLAEVSALQRVLRDLPHVPTDWRSLLPRESLRDGLYESLRLESWVLHRTAVTGGFESQAGEFPLPDLLVYRGIREVTAKLDETIERSKREDFRYFNVDQFHDEVQATIPRWNVVARILLPNLLDAPVKAARSELDLELTTIILESRERAEWVLAQEPDGREPSQAVPGIVWERSHGPGWIRIRAVGGEIRTGSKAPLPLDVRVAIPSLE